MKGFRLHDLRHCFASISLKQKTSVKDVSSCSDILIPWSHYRRMLTRWKGSDSEADAFIFDDAPPATGSLTFTPLLRCDLWSEHLGIPAGNLTDGVASVSNWITSSPSSRVLPYDPAGDTTRPSATPTAFTTPSIRRARSYGASSAPFKAYTR